MSRRRLAGAWLVFCVAAALTPTPDHLGGCVVMYESRAYAHGLAFLLNATTLEQLVDGALELRPDGGAAPAPSLAFWEATTRVNLLYAAIHGLRLVLFRFDRCFHPAHAHGAAPLANLAWCKVVAIREALDRGACRTVLYLDTDAAIEPAFGALALASRAAIVQQGYKPPPPRGGDGTEPAPRADAATGDAARALRGVLANSGVMLFRASPFSRAACDAWWRVPFAKPEYLLQWPFENGAWEDEVLSRDADVASRVAVESERVDDESADAAGAARAAGAADQPRGQRARRGRRFNSFDGALVRHVSSYWTRETRDRACAAVLRRARAAARAALLATPGADDGAAAAASAGEESTDAYNSAEAGAASTPPRPSSRP